MTNAMVFPVSHRGQRNGSRASNLSGRASSALIGGGRRICTGDCHGQRQALDLQAETRFSKTQEPSGAAKLKASNRRRFVIQKHDATRLHYDLRLELDGVFKSWAVTKGPSLDPHDKRLAVEVEDHPLDYGDFEGTIPKGQYGGGTVMLWDRGYWEPEGNKTPEQALAKGDFKFTLEESGCMAASFWCGCAMTATGVSGRIGC